MAPRKLSDSDKRQITSIYCQPGETTSTLANKFGISSSTVSRVLKQMLPDEEYAKLMKWKRSGERGSFPLASSDVVEQLEVEVPSPPESATTDVETTTTERAEAEQQPDQTDETEEQEGRSPVKEIPARRSRHRATTETADAPAAPVAVQSEKPDEATSVEGTESSEETEEKSSKPKPVLKPRSQSPATTSEPDPEDDDDDSEVAAWVSEGLQDAADYDEDSDEDWDEEDWDDESEEDEAAPKTAPREAELTIHSFENFSLTKSCYLVVDRTAELVTCPLKDFSELGMIPAGEEQAKTLPVFDNHRIARRFAHRNQRIIKVPDGVMLTKTQDYLQAKGITRILFDGQVYALSH